MKFFIFILVSIGLQIIDNSLSAANAGPKDAKNLGKELMNNLPGIFSLDEEHTEKMGKYQVPPIVNGNWVLKSKPVSLVESFTAQTNAIATIFVKVDNEFIRLMTTEPKEKAGTILDHSSPAYVRLLGELRYTGKVTLSGTEYMTDYDVFRDRQGRVIGAYVVGIPL